MVKNLTRPSFPFYLQSSQCDCGPTCLKMIAAYYGREFSLYQMENWVLVQYEGTSMTDIADYAEKLGTENRYL